MQKEKKLGETSGFDQGCLHLESLYKNLRLGPTYEVLVPWSRVMSWPSEDWESSQDWDLEQKVAVKTRPPEAIYGILRNKWRDADCP